MHPIQLLLFYLKSEVNVFTFIAYFRSWSRDNERTRIRIIRLWIVGFKCYRSCNEKFLNPVWARSCIDRSKMTSIRKCRQIELFGQVQLLKDFNYPFLAPFFCCIKGCIAIAVILLLVPCVETCASMVKEDYPILVCQWLE